MRKYLFLLAGLSLVFLLVSCSPAPQEPTYEIQDGGFESGSIDGWFTEAEDGDFTFSLISDAFEGQHALALANAGEEDEICTVKKTFSENPPLRRYFKLSSQVKTTGKTHMAVLAEVDGKERHIATTRRQEPIPTDGEWHPWDVKFFVPPESTRLLVQCSVQGNCEAAFDNLLVEEIEREAGIRAALTTPGIACAQGADDYVASKDVERYESVFPLPTVNEYQTPISFHLEVDPPEKLISWEIFHRMGDNWVCKVAFGPMKKDEMVKVRYWSDVIMGSADFSSFPETAPIPDKDSYPEDVKVWLEPTIAAQSDHPKIINEAQRLLKEAGEKDAVAFIKVMLESMKTIKFQKPTGCDAISMLEQGGACTSHANLGAALCRVVGIPARVIANYPVWNVAFQTHYIIEAWIDGCGWIPVETSMYQFPQDPFRQVYVSRVLIQDEQDSFDENRFAAPGVPKWSLNERDTQSGVDNSYENPPLNQKYCDHMAFPTAQFAADADIVEILDLGRKIWTAYQNAKTGKEENPELTGAVEIRLDPAPQTVKDLLKHLQRLEAFFK